MAGVAVGCWDEPACIPGSNGGRAHRDAQRKGPWRFTANLRNHDQDRARRSRTTPGVAWVPLPLTRPAPYQVDRGHTVGGNADKTRVERLTGSGAAVLVAEWGHMMPPPELIVTTKVETSDHRVSLTTGNGAKRSADLANYPEAHQTDSHRRHRQADCRCASRKGRRPISRRRAPSTTGSSRTRFAIRT